MAGREVDSVVDLARMCRPIGTSFSAKLSFEHSQSKSARRSRERLFRGVAFGRAGNIQGEIPIQGRKFLGHFKRHFASKILSFFVANFGFICCI